MVISAAVGERLVGRSAGRVPLRPAARGGSAASARTGLEPGDVARVGGPLGDEAPERAEHRPARVDELDLAVLGKGRRVGGEADRVPAVVAGVLAVEPGGRDGEGAEVERAVGAVPVLFWVVGWWVSGGFRGPVRGSRARAGARARGAAPTTTPTHHSVVFAIDLAWREDFLVPVAFLAAVTTRADCEGRTRGRNQMGRPAEVGAEAPSARAAVPGGRQGPSAAAGRGVWARRRPGAPRRGARRGRGRGAGRGLRGRRRATS